MLQSLPHERIASAPEVLQALTTQPAPMSYPPTQAPLSQTEATMAVAPPAAAAANSLSPIPAETSSPSSTDNPSSDWLRNILLVLILIPVAGSVGWLAGNWWIHSQTESRHVEPQPTETSPVASPSTEPTPSPSSSFSPEEQRRKEALQQRRVALDIRYNFYASLVNEEFWKQYPSQQGRTLSSEPDDADWRAKWDAIASDLLAQLNRLNLSDAARRQLGGYTEADLNRVKAEANQLHVGSRSLYDIADVKFLQAFPQEKGKNFISKPIGQVWQAIVADTLSAVKTGDAFERIVFAPGAISKEVSGTLKPGQGKVFIAGLVTGQMMKVNLQTRSRVLFSIYSPSGKTTLLEDSSDRTWSGSLPESGFYEFVIVSSSSEPVNYQLNLTVENATPTEPTPIESPS
jgi:serine/threonine-protein kinase